MQKHNWLAMSSNLSKQIMTERKKDQIYVLNQCMYITIVGAVLILHISLAVGLYK